MLLDCCSLLFFFNEVPYWGFKGEVYRSQEEQGERGPPAFQVKTANTHICTHIEKTKQEGKSIALVKTHFQI